MKKLEMTINTKTSWELLKYIWKLEEENKKLSEKIGQLEEENRKLKEERDKYYAEWHLRHS